MTADIVAMAAEWQHQKARCASDPVAAMEWMAGHDWQAYDAAWRQIHNANPELFRVINGGRT